MKHEVYCFLPLRVNSSQLGLDEFLHVFYSLSYAPIWIGNYFALASACARGCGGSSSALFGFDFDLYRLFSANVENLSCSYALDYC